MFAAPPSSSTTTSMAPAASSGASPSSNGAANPGTSSRGGAPFDPSILPASAGKPRAAAAPADEEDDDDHDTDSLEGLVASVCETSLEGVTDAVAALAVDELVNDASDDDPVAPRSKPPPAKPPTALPSVAAPPVPTVTSRQVSTQSSTGSVASSAAGPGASFVGAKSSPWASLAAGNSVAAEGAAGGPAASSSGAGDFYPARATSANPNPSLTPPPPQQQQQGQPQPPQQQQQEWMGKSPLDADKSSGHPPAGMRGGPGNNGAALSDSFASRGGAQQVFPPQHHLTATSALYYPPSQGIPRSVTPPEQDPMMAMNMGMIPDDEHLIELRIEELRRKLANQRLQKQQGSAGGLDLAAGNAGGSRYMPAPLQQQMQQLQAQQQQAARFSDWRGPVGSAPTSSRVVQQQQHMQMMNANGGGLDSLFGGGGVTARASPPLPESVLSASPSTPNLPSPDVPLEALEGHFLALSQEQNGCRYLQQRIAREGASGAALVLREVFPHLVPLLLDPFANYMYQKLLEFADPPSRLAMLSFVRDHLILASLNLHGTRSVQKHIEVGGHDKVQRDIIAAELAPHVTKLSMDTNGNHVVQRMLQNLDDASFVTTTITEDLLIVTRHRHGCCVVQRCLDAAPAAQRKALVAKIEENALVLAQDPFANYCVQYIIEHARGAEGIRIVSLMRGRIVQLSKQKFSSNVVERCLSAAPHHLLQELVDEAVSVMGELLHDQYGNFVAQKLVEPITTDAQARAVVAAMRVHLPDINASCARRIATKIAKRFPDTVHDEVIRHALGMGAASVVGGTIVGGFNMPMVGGQQQGGYMNVVPASLPSLSAGMPGHQQQQQGQGGMPHPQQQQQQQRVPQYQPLPFAHHHPQQHQQQQMAHSHHAQHFQHKA